MVLGGEAAGGRAAGPSRRICTHRPHLLSFLRLLGCKTGVDPPSPSRAVPESPDQPGLGSAPRPEREPSSPGQRGPAARKGGGEELGTRCRGPAPRPPRAAARCRARLALSGAGDPLLSPGNGEAASATSWGHRTFPGIRSRLTPGADRQAQPLPNVHSPTQGSPATGAHPRYTKVQTQAPMHPQERSH